MAFVGISVSSVAAIALVVAASTAVVVLVLVIDSVSLDCVSAMNVAMESDVDGIFYTKMK